MIPTDRSANNAVVRLPGSKSEANRLLAFAAFVGNNFCIKNVPTADDVQLFLNAMRTAGLDWTESDWNIRVHGRIQDAQIP